MVAAAIREGAGEKHLVPYQRLRFLGGIDTLERYQGAFVAAEPIGLHEKGHQDALHIDYQKVGSYPVEDIVFHLKGEFAFHAVGLAQAADAVNFVLLNQSHV